MDCAESETHDYQYDVVVLGGGSGGLAASKTCQALGKKVAVLDFVKPTPIGTKWGLGGTCVNVGCIPKKLMHTAGLHGEGAEDSKEFGWDFKGTHNWETLKDNITSYVRSLNWGYRTELRTVGVEYLNAFGTFVDPHTMQTEGSDGKIATITARRFILAMGGRPTYPTFPGAVEYGITSDDIFSLATDPGKVCVIGASYVALECAGFLTAIGKDVTVIVRSIPLRGFDQEMAEKVLAYMGAHGTKIVRPSVPDKLELTPDGRRSLTYTITGDAQEVVTEVFDTVLFAIGRKPCTSGIGLESTGVTLAASGNVIVDKWDRTSTPHIYAIGDIQEGGLELTPVAIKAGKLLCDRLFNSGRKPMDYINVPTTVFTPLEYGACGFSEEAAISKFGKDDIEVFHSEMVPLEWQLGSRKESPCFTKLICQKSADLQVIGFHILAPHAGEVTQGVSIAMKMGATKAVFDDTVGIHPTVSETFCTLTVTKSSGESASAGGGC